MQDESTYTGTDRSIWHVSSPPPGPRPPVLAGDTFTVQYHQPPNAATRKEHTKSGLFPGEQRDRSTTFSYISMGLRPGAIPAPELLLPFEGFMWF